MSNPIRVLFSYLLLPALLGVYPSSVWAVEARSVKYVLDASALSASGAKAIAPLQELLWGTLWQTAGEAFASPNFQGASSYPAQLRVVVVQGLRRDTTPPRIFNMQPPTGSFTNQRRPTISADYADGSPSRSGAASGIDVLSVVLKVDGQDVTSQATVTLTRVTYLPPANLAEGPHTITVDVSDVVGNRAKQLRATFTVDTVPPTVSNLTPPNGGVVGNPRPTIAASYADPAGINVSSVTLTVDGQNVTSQSTVTPTSVSYVPPTVLLDGSHDVIVSVSDTAGNTQQTPWSFEVDTIPPVVYMTTPVDRQAVRQTPLDVIGFVSDPHMGTVTVNGLPAMIVQTTFTATVPLTKGSNPIQALATDQVGNQRSQTITVTLDMVAPVVAITSPPNQATIEQTSVTVEGTVDDPTASVFVNSIPAVTISPGTWRALGVPLGIGANQLTAVATDPAGNQATVSITVQTTTQTNPVTLQATPQSGTAPLNVTFTPASPLPNLVRFQYDWEGDGVVDLTTTTSQPVTHSYTAVNIYQPTLTAQTSAGLLFSATTTINVHEPAAIVGTVDVPAPVDVAADAAGLIYVLSRSQAEVRVYRFDEQTNQFQLQQTIRAPATSPWTDPEGLELTDLLALFVADTGNHRIQKFIPDPQGNYNLDPTFGTNGSLGAFGTGPSQFNRPFDVALDADELIYVSDSLNHRIQQFTSQGIFIRAFGALGSQPGEFNGPQGITYSVLTREVWVVDSSNHRLQAFDGEGVVVRAIGTMGSGQGQFNAPANVSVDAIFDQVVVADKNNNRAQLLDRYGAFSQELAGLGLANPQTVCARPMPTTRTFQQRILYVADTGNNRLLRINVPQGSSQEDPLAPYRALIAALQANDLEAAVRTYVAHEQPRRRHLLEILRVNDPNSLVRLGNEMAQDPTPIFIRRIGDEALYVIGRQENSVMIEYNLFLRRENGQWKILQL